MGVAIDTIGVYYTNAATTAATLQTASASPGDSLSVRSFAGNSWAKLESVFVQGSGAEKVRITSPRMHDNVTGLTFETAETPSEFLLPMHVGEPLYSSDTLSVAASAAASSSTVAPLLTYYADLPGIDAALLTWAQVKSRLIRLKTVEVDVTSNATVGTWSDTLITATENQLKADYEYAVLGFESSSALACQGIKGPATGNLRVCAPGATSTLDITSYFVEMGERHNTPHIPVFKANDRNSTYVSVLANTASATAHVYMILAQLS